MVVISMAGGFLRSWLLIASTPWHSDAESASQPPHLLTLAFPSFRVRGTKVAVSPNLDISVSRKTNARSAKRVHCFVTRLVRNPVAFRGLGEPQIGHLLASARKTSMAAAVRFST